MIRHLVLFKFKPGIPESRIDDLFAALDALPIEIPAIVEVVHGENFSDRSQGYTHVVSMRLIDREALQSFYKHPAHTQLKADFIDPIADGMLVADYPESLGSPA